MAAPFRNKEKFRKVSPQIWGDKKFRALPVHTKLAFVFVLTHPNLTALGAMRHTAQGMAAEIGWEAGEFRKAFDELTALGMVRYDAEASFVWLPNFLRYNGPDNPNVVKGWRGALALLPECEGKRQLIQAAKKAVSSRGKAFEQALPEPFHKPFGEPLPEPFGEGMPNMEQEQEQELLLGPQQRQQRDDAAAEFLSILYRPWEEGGCGVDAGTAAADLGASFTVGDLRLIRAKVGRETGILNRPGRVVAILKMGPDSALMRQLREQAAAKAAPRAEPLPPAPDIIARRQAIIERLANGPASESTTSGPSRLLPNAPPGANANGPDDAETPA